MSISAGTGIIQLVLLRYLNRDGGVSALIFDMHRYHRPEHPPAVRLRRRAERRLRQPVEDEAVAGRVSGGAE